MANSLMVIFPFKRSGVWCFTDPEKQLEAEPFVCGATELIDKAVAAAGIPNAENGFKLFFSTSPFPGAAVKLTWEKPESGGNWFSCSDFGPKMDLWLCQAMYKYLDTAPRELYATAYQ